MNPKIQATHRERAAYVYVRQSSMHQVRQHQESRRRQYDLAEQAQQLGFSQVVVIDDDLGRSGAGAEDRPGFGKLLTAVCEGKAGAVFALEASRLARNNREWHHLIDLCALTDTLVVDADGTYDPRHLNDRLLLGLKGSMAEFELGLLRQRAQEALLAMIARGQMLWEAPIGYERTAENKVEKTPDRQVQQALGAVFSKFRELGSARQVLLWHQQEKISLPCLVRSETGIETQWRLPIYNQILKILQNPIYAGAFAYGRTTSKITVRQGKAKKTHNHKVPLDQWKVLIRDHHPGYISWEVYLQNQKQIETNGGMRGVSQAAKSGPALLAGLLRCRRCGRNLHVGYSGVGGRVPRYYCRGAHLNHGGKWCISFGGLRVDTAVADAVLEAVQPAGVQAALDAWKEASQQRSEKRLALELALQKARFQAERARRQYDKVEPENRLVASELEAKWNAALANQHELEQRLAQEENGEEPVDEMLQRRLLALGADLFQAWRHPDAPVELKKRILRCVLTEIMVDISDDPAEIQMQLHWAGGVHTSLRVRKNPIGKHRRCAGEEVVDLVRELAKVCNDAKMAAILNRLGYKTGAGHSWIESRVRSIRHYHKIPASPKKAPRPWITLAEAAKELQISPSSVRRLIQKKILAATQVVAYAPWVIRREDLEKSTVQESVQAIREGRRIPRSNPQQQELPLN